MNHSFVIVYGLMGLLETLKIEKDTSVVSGLWFLVWPK